MAELGNMEKEVLNSVISILNDENFSEIRAKTEDFKDPMKIVRKGTKDGYIPDVMAEKNGAIYLIELEMDKKIDQKNKLKKWKLFSAYSKANKGKLHLVVPQGRKQQVIKILQQNDISAGILEVAND